VLWHPKNEEIGWREVAKGSPKRTPFASWRTNFPSAALHSITSW